MDNKKEVDIDASEAKVEQAEIENTHISTEQIRNIYPEEDPRKFNTHYDEQEAVEYESKDHSQPIDGIKSVDKEHIHAAREEKEKVRDKEYPKVQVWAVALQGFLTAASLFFFSAPMFLTAMAFVAGVLIMPNYKLLGKTYPKLGFNPFIPLLVVDIFLMAIGFILLVASIF